MPPAHALAVMAIAIAAFYLYTHPAIRMELVSLLLLIGLVLLFFFFPLDEGTRHFAEIDVLAGFGHPALVAICCLMILGRGLLVTGALEPLVRLLVPVWRWSASLGLLLTLLLAAGASAFINDTPVVVLLLPLLLSIAERTGTHPAGTLMPVNFAVLAGGMLTAIGSSTNILVLSIAVDLGMRPIGILGFVDVAAVALLCALPYLWLVAPRLLPQRAPAPGVAAKQYEAQLRVAAGGRLCDRSLAELARSLGRPLPVRVVHRGDELPAPTGELVLRDGDLVMLADTPRGLQEVSLLFATELFDPAGAGRWVREAGQIEPGEKLLEVVVGPRSRLVGSTLAESRFAEHFAVVAVAVHRNDEDLLRPAVGIGDVELQAGDLLLLQGRADRLEALRGQWDLLLLDSALPMPQTPKAPLALAIMAAVILAAVSGVLPIHIASLAGVAAMLATGCLPLDGVGRALSPAVILLVASSLALGQGLVQSGAADWIAGGVAAAVEPLPAALQVACFMGFAALLTNFVSNSAAAAVGTPIAVAMARQLGVPIEPFVLAILFGANLSYATPMAYQTNVLVMHAAGYSFRDFVRVGTPLVLLMLAVLSYALAQRYLP